MSQIICHRPFSHYFDLSLRSVADVRFQKLGVDEQHSHEKILYKTIRILSDCDYREANQAQIRVAEENY